MYAQTDSVPVFPMVSETAEEFIRGHLESLFKFVNFFLEDSARALHLTESAFRDVMAEGLLSRNALYGAACEALREPSQASFVNDGLSRESALCWLLKDFAGLSYVDIAAVLSLDPRQVRHRIAEARGLMLAAV